MIDDFPGELSIFQAANQTCCWHLVDDLAILNSLSKRTLLKVLMLLFHCHRQTCFCFPLDNIPVTSHFKGTLWSCPSCQWSNTIPLWPYILGKECCQFRWENCIRLFCVTWKTRLNWGCSSNKSELECSNVEDQNSLGITHPGLITLVICSLSISKAFSTSFGFQWEWF